MYYMFVNNISNSIRAKFLLCSVVLMLLSVESFSQREYKHDVSMGYGAFTSNQILDIASDVLERVGFPEGNTTSGEQYYGGFSINYRNSISEYINTGITFSYDKVTKDVLSKELKVGDLNRDFYTIAAEVDWRYFKREIFQIYSLAGIGYTFISDRYMPFRGEEVTKGDSGIVNFHISVLGIRLGKELAFYSELGFGYKGIFSVGFSYQF